MGLGRTVGWTDEVMAGVMDIQVESLERWKARQETSEGPATQGRPEVIGPEARERIRQCYVEHFCQWGPRTLAHWARREGLGTWSPCTVAKVIEDLREEPEAPVAVRRYEVVAPMAMWSEDGTGLRERALKRELLVAQDECSRFKVNHRLVHGPASAKDVYEYLEQAFRAYGAPLVLKHDGGSIFHDERVRGLLDRWEVTDLTGPSHYPQYNGKKERSMRDIKSYVRAMARHGHDGSLVEKIDEAVDDLNTQRPRPVLAGRTSLEVFTDDRKPLPSHAQFRKEVNRRERELLQQAMTRSEREGARRRAIWEVLFDLGLLEETADVSTNSPAENPTD